MAVSRGLLYSDSPSLVFPDSVHQVKERMWNPSQIPLSDPKSVEGSQLLRSPFELTSGLELGLKLKPGVSAEASTWMCLQVLVKVTAVTKGLSTLQALVGPHTGVSDAVGRGWS